MSIFKGVLGKDMDFLTSQLREQAMGGIDLVKDDEILFEKQPYTVRSADKGRKKGVETGL